MTAQSHTQVGIRLGAVLLAFSVATCGEEEQDTAPAFRGYAETAGIVYSGTSRWMNVTEGRPRAIQDETAVLHYAVATLAISLMSWKDERKASGVADVTRQMTVALAASGTRSASDWEAHLVKGAAAYERGLPTPRESWLQRSPSGWGPADLQLSDTQLRQIGAVMVQRVLAHPDAPAGTPEDLDAWALSVGRYFRSRLNQLMEGIDGMPG